MTAPQHHPWWRYLPDGSIICDPRPAASITNYLESVIAATNSTQPSAGGKPRADLVKSWLACVDVLSARTRAAERMRNDDRFVARIPILVRTRSDLMRARDAIDRILDDFDRYSPIIPTATIRGESCGDESNGEVSG